MKKEITRIEDYIEPEVVESKEVDTDKFVIGEMIKHDGLEGRITESRIEGEWVIMTIENTNGTRTYSKELITKYL